MKTTVLIFLALFMVALTIKTTAQVTGTNPIPKTTALPNEVSRNPDADKGPATPGSRSPRLRLDGTESPIYIGDDWPLGTVLLRDGGKIDTYHLRYNLLADQMQFINGKDTLAFASPHELITLAFGGHTFVYETYQCENVIREGYFELLVPGINKLLQKKVVTYLIPDGNDPDNAASTKYLTEDNYFISKPGQPATKLLCNRKSALSVLNKHNTEIEEYLRITGNKVRNIEDLKKLVTYYNSLE
jgi:hypothetical protein